MHQAQPIRATWGQHPAAIVPDHCGYSAGRAFLDQENHAPAAAGATDLRRPAPISGCGRNEFVDERRGNTRGFVRRSFHSSRSNRATSFQSARSRPWYMSRAISAMRSKLRNTRLSPLMWALKTSQLLICRLSWCARVGQHEALTQSPRAASGLNSR